MFISKTLVCVPIHKKQSFEFKTEHKRTIQNIHFSSSVAAGKFFIYKNEEHVATLFSGILKLYETGEPVITKNADYLHTLKFSKNDTLKLEVENHDLLSADFYVSFEVI